MGGSDPQQWGSGLRVVRVSLDPRLLLGRWELSRVIDDRFGAERSEVHGTLAIMPGAGGALEWHESGWWHRGTTTVEVSRRLLLRERHAGWWVLFEDGRPFHPWTPGAQVVHPCGADTYRGMVTGAADRWTVRWDVEGPAKDYSMTSVLTPGL